MNAKLKILVKTYYSYYRECISYPYTICEMEKIECCDKYDNISEENCVAISPNRYNDIKYIADLKGYCHSEEKTCFKGRYIFMPTLRLDKDDGLLLRRELTIETFLIMTLFTRQYRETPDRLKSLAYVLSPEQYEEYKSDDFHMDLDKGIYSFSKNETPMDRLICEALLNYKIYASKKGMYYDELLKEVEQRFEFYIRCYKTGISGYE